MKLAKLSLAAMMVAGLASSSFAADTLADAFKNGKVNGAVQGYYWTKDTGNTTAEIFTTGLDLSYETAKLYGFAFKGTFQSSSSPFINQDGRDNYGDMHGSGAVLSEAYLSYTLGKTTALVGRMYLDTPLVASSGSRMTKQSFEGAAIINTDLPDTTLIAGYVQKFQDRTDGDGNIGKFKREFGTGSGVANDLHPEIEDGAFTVAAINKSITGLTLTAAYAQANDLKGIMDRLSIAYAEADYKGKAGSFSYGLAAQYYDNDFGGNDTTYDANNLWATKLSLGYDAFGAYVAYSKVNDKTNGLGVVSGLGGGADLAYTGSPIMSSSYENDTEAYKVGATYAIMKNANVGVSYTVNDIDSADYEAAFAAIEADYAFEGALNGLNTALIFEDGSKDASGKNAMRLNVNYKF